MYGHGAKIDPVILDGDGKGTISLNIKGDEERSFHLSSKAVEVIKRAVRGRRTGYIFLNPRTCDRYKSIHKVFDRSIKEIGIKVGGSQIRFHDIRHVFASNSLLYGGNLNIIQKLLGHKDRNTTDRYVHISQQEEIRTLAKMPTYDTKSNSRDKGLRLVKFADTN